jgi:hypothetical protein
MSDIRGEQAVAWRFVADYCTKQAEALAGASASPLFTDRINEMARSDHPFNADITRLGLFDWPVLTEVTGVTIHHTMSHSPEATARYCVNTKGHATIQYHFWVSAGDGCPVWQLVELDRAIWHDHTGAHLDGRATLSVGLAGSLHIAKPPDEQLQAAARLVVWLMDEYDLPREQVQGHCDRAGAGVTVCPGWYEAGWRPDWEAALTLALLEAHPQ